MYLTAKKGAYREIRLHAEEIVNPPVNLQDLPLSAATEIEWVMSTGPTATTATLTKTYTGSDITWIDDGDDGWLKFALSATDTARTGTFYWELRITLGGVVYKSEEIGVIEFLDALAVA